MKSFIKELRAAALFIPNCTTQPAPYEGNALAIHLLITIRSNKELKECFFGMQSVFGLIKHSAPGSVNNLIGYLLPSMRRKTVQNKGIFISPAE